MNRLAIVAAVAAVSFSAAAAPITRLAGGNAQAIDVTTGLVAAVSPQGGAESGSPVIAYDNRTANATASGAAPRTSFADDFFITNATSADVTAVEFGFVAIAAAGTTINFDILFSIYDTINYAATGTQSQFSDATPFILSNVSVTVPASGFTFLSTGLITLPAPVSLTASAGSGLDVDGAFSVAFVRPGQTTISPSTVVAGNSVTAMLADTAVVTGPTVGDFIDGFWRDGALNSGVGVLDGVYASNELRGFAAPSQSNLWLGVQAVVTPIPEPTSLGLVGLAAMAAFRRRRA